jgi:hypothetical protein
MNGGLIEAGMNMSSRFAKAQVAIAVSVIWLVLSGDCAFADKRIALAPSAQQHLKLSTKAAQGDGARAAAAAAAAEPEADAASGSSCEDQQGQLEAILEKGSEGSGLEELQSFSKTVTCERLGPVVIAAIDRFNAEAAAHSGAVVNSLELVRAAQVELARLGCFDGKIDGSLTTTEDALVRYRSSRGQKMTSPDITDALVADLAKETDQVCPMSCKNGEISKGDTCIVNASPSEPITATRREEGHEASQGQQSEPLHGQPNKPKAAEATMHSSSGGHSGGAGANSMVGVGF